MLNKEELLTNKYLSLSHTGRQANMGDDSGKFPGFSGFPDFSDFLIFIFLADMEAEIQIAFPVNYRYAM